MVIIDTTRDAVIEQAKFQTQINLVGRLPAQSRARQAGHQIGKLLSGGALAKIVIACAQTAQSGVCTYVAVAGNTPSSSDLEVGNRFNIFHKSFLRHGPAQAHGRVVEVLKAWRKRGRTIAAEGKGCQVLTGKTIVHAAHERQQACFRE